MKILKTLLKCSTLRQNCYVHQCYFLPVIYSSRNSATTFHQTCDFSKISSGIMSDDFSAKEDLAKESDDLDIDVEEELAERFIDQPGKFTAKIIPRACFVTRDFFYFNAYCLAKELSNRSQAEFLYPILKNGQNDCDRSLKEMYLLCELPTGCYHFHPKHRFPDDACLDNYVSIVDLSVVNKRIDRLGLSKTLLGLAKISSVDDDLINKIGGFMRLTKWFAFAYGEKQTAFDAHLEAR